MEETFTAMSNLQTNVCLELVLIMKNSLVTAIDISFYFLNISALKHREIDENPHRSIAAPLMLMVH